MVLILKMIREVITKMKQKIGKRVHLYTFPKLDNKENTTLMSPAGHLAKHPLLTFRLLCNISALLSTFEREPYTMLIGEIHLASRAVLGFEFIFDVFMY